ncbi:MAG TPA: serine/threonine-protein phosphatase [Acidimicrobiaceae bacterium]|nr:serine/threonine-protein phosphatase [Acidimicrobiaceae bacterium]
MTGKPAGGGSEMRLKWAGATDPGLVRLQNQDAMYADPGLFVVADGLGAPGNGDVASGLAVRAMASRSPDSTGALVAAVEHANRVVHTRSVKQAELSGMGTTLCAMAVFDTDDGHRIGLVNVGDSRAYRHQDGRLELLTVDHTRVAEMVRYGMITPAEALDHKDRNTLTRAIGVAAAVEVDDWLLDISGGDRYLLCSDGVTAELSDDEIAEILATQFPAADAASALVRTANEKGGKDNSTALVVDVQITHAGDDGQDEAQQEPAPASGRGDDAGSGAAGAKTGRRRWFSSRRARG